VFGESLANFAARRGDTGKTARRQHGGRCQRSKDAAASDHGSFSFRCIKSGGDDARHNVVKRWRRGWKGSRIVIASASEAIQKIHGDTIWIASAYAQGRFGGL
jgi:hypothetical protein